MNFTYPKKQWVMTTALLAVLGFNVSFNSYDKVASADFASVESVETKLATADGVLAVTYFKVDENDKVTARIKQLTEGKICDTCETRSIQLNSTSLQNVDDLNVLVAKALVAETTTAKKETKKDKKDKKDDKTEILEKISEKCEKHDEDAEKLQCLTPKFLDALKKDKEDISEAEAMDFFKDEIEKLIKNEMHDSHRIAMKNLKSKIRGSSWDYYDEEDESRDASEVLEETLELVKELHGKIPSKYKDVRKRLFKIQTEIVDEEALQVQRTIVQSSRQTDPRERLLLHQEADGRNYYLNEILKGLNQSSVEGMSDARRSGFLSASDRDIFGDTWGNYASEIRRSMNQFLYEYAATGKTPSSLVAGAYDLGSGYGTRLANPGRSSDSVLVNTRTGTRLDGQTTSSVNIPKDNVNITFGEMTAISDASKDMRTKIRKVFGK
ncbi:hypothetical protein [Bdellovibrio reynosensis]|uniref:Uncharacterized protein n=1 Tax=Bdellovibrio reynosensis TaxID=2835041 RepID=A0ABY4C7M2_9BACT|nr:hypothetical protein [Bdellovibrio reynosensis]UOF00915.1 hypothetical protein MNR06_14530 [Bdellovibrio reynosensis]